MNTLCLRCCKTSKNKVKLSHLHNESVNMVGCTEVKPIENFQQKLLFAQYY